MFKDLRISLFMCLVILLLTGCTTSMLERKYIGKRLPSTLLKPIASPSGQHLWELKHLDIEYDYRIDIQAQTITFDGTIKYNLAPEESTYLSETVLLDIKRCEFRLLFTDSTKSVIGVAVENIFPDKNIYETILFKKTVSFKKAYKYMVFSYFLYSEGV